MEETGAKIEAYMHVWRGTCGAKHLWKQTHTSSSRGGVHGYSTHMWRRAARDTRMPRHVRPETWQMCRQVDTHEGSSQVARLLVPAGPVHPKEAEAPQALALRRLHPEQGWGQDTSYPFGGPPSPVGSCSPREHLHPASRQ